MGAAGTQIPVGWFVVKYSEASMKKVVLLFTTLLLLGGAAQGQDKASQKFITEAIQGNFAEVAMGELAQKNGQSGQVKSYGEMLQNEHSEANKKAMEAAKAVGVTPPNGPSAKQKSHFDKMAKMSGPSFDKMFAKHMVEDHRKDIAAYQKAAGCLARAHMRGLDIFLITRGWLHAELSQPLLTSKRQRRGRGASLHSRRDPLYRQDTESSEFADAHPPNSCIGTLCLRLQRLNDQVGCHPPLFYRLV
jgi:putative membrane protein